MSTKLLKTIIILPGTVLIFVPAVILFTTSKNWLAPEIFNPERLLFWLGLAAALFGFFLAVWTVSLFTKFGQGTPAPWDPPQKLVVRGPYMFLRNPMITGVLFMLLAETLLFQSWPLFLWMIIFHLANVVYFPLFEERSLEKRFGADYLEYKKHVPRWLPRLTPWYPPER